MAINFPQVDASVISQIPDAMPNPAEARARGFKLADLINTEQLNKLEMNEEKRKLKEAEDIRTTLKGEDLSTPEGVSKAAQKLTTGGHAEQGLKLMMTAQDYASGAAKLQSERANAELARIKSYKEKMDIVASRFDEIRAPLDAAKKAGATPEALDLMAVQTIVPALKKLAQDMPEVEPQVKQFLNSKDHLTYSGLVRAEEETNKGQIRFDQEIKKRELDLRGREVAVRERVAASNVGDESDLDTNAKAIAEYREAPPTLSSRNPRGYKLMARVMELNPDYDANQYKAGGAAEKAFATGKQGDTVRSLNVAIQHLNLLSGLGKDLKNTDSRAVNSFFNAIGKQFGKPNVTNFETAKSIVGDEVVKAVIGSGAGSLTDREDLQKKFDAASSPEQLAGVIKTSKGLMSGQLKGLRQQYESSTGKKDFDKMLSPETKAALEDSDPQTITTDEEYNKLPSGATFVGPDGKTRKKP